MPGFIIHTGLSPFELALENRKKLVVETIKGDCFFAQRRVVNKFMNDRIFLDTKEYTVIVEGVVLNNHDLIDEYASESWAGCVVKMYETVGDAFFNYFRGSFSGALFDKQAAKWIVYTGHTGEKQVFFTQVPGGYLFGSEMRFIVKALKQNGLPVTLDKTGCYMSLTYGYCLEDRTLVLDVHKLVAGHYLRLTESGLEVIQYHRFTNEPDMGITQKDAIEGIDGLFRQAIQRQFEKDCEYGYRHIACLSGGLDSRMTVWVAHDLGYLDQVNIDYSQSGYLDFTISQQIAIDLHHDYFFHPLDGGDFIPRYKFKPDITYGNGFLMGHGYSFEQFIDYEPYGIFHTGQLGDVIVGSYLTKADYSELTMSDGAMSNYLMDRLADYDLHFLYPNSEMFRLYNRGLNGINQGLLTFQENTESCSPFMDVDFFSFCLALPLSFRVNHRIYIDWVLNKYPGAAKYVWENTGRVISPIKFYTPRYMSFFGVRVPHFSDPAFPQYVRGFILRRLGLRRKGKGLSTVVKDTPNNMTPVDFWYDTNPALKLFIESFWENNHTRVIDQDLLSDMGELISRDAVYDKLQCLNLLAAIVEITE